MESPRIALLVFLSVLALCFISQGASAQYGYYPPAARMYSINGYGGSYHQATPMMNRGGYYPVRPYYPSFRPYTIHLDQYHHIEYNKPGRVGWPDSVKYYNANPAPRSRQWSRVGR